MMQQPKKIMVAVPPTELAPAVIARARALALQFGSELRLVACVYDPYVAGERFADSPDLQQARAALVEASQERLQAAAGPLVDDDGLVVSTHASWAYPVYEGLVEQAEQYDAELVVAGTFRHSLVQRFGLSNTDWQLIRTCQCPVLLIRQDQFDGYRDILVPVDPMHTHDKPASLDDRLIEAAKTIGGAFGARIHLLHCYLSAEYLPLLAPGAAMPAVFYTRQSSLDRHKQSVDKLVEKHQIDPALVYLESGDARHLIPEITERSHASLVVMGAVSRSRLRRLLIGSTAEAVLDRLDCDVLVVKPPAQN